MEEDKSSNLKVIWLELFVNDNLYLSLLTSNSIVLDSFAGSGTTAHAVLKMNMADGGNRKFIGVEMMDYAETITAERVRRVIAGYNKGKKSIEGTGGNFSYYELGEPLMLDSDHLNENVGKDKIREYIANHFIADTVVKTDMKDIVKAMEEGVRLGMEEQKSAEMRDSRQIALMIDNGRRSGVIEGRKQVVDNPEEYGLCKPSEWSEEDENHFKHILNVLEDVQGKQMEKGFNNLNSDICWFESLRLRAKPHWKPSKVQIDILWDALSNLRHDGYKHMEELESLYNDIKKL